MFQKMRNPYTVSTTSFADFLSAISGLKKEIKPTPRSNKPSPPKGRLPVRNATINIKIPAKKDRGLRSIKPKFLIVEIVYHMFLYEYEPFWIDKTYKTYSIIKF